jgi:hypothetical protein
MVSARGRAGGVSLEQRRVGVNRGGRVRHILSDQAADLEGTGRGDETVKEETVRQDTSVVRHSFVVRISREMSNAHWRGWVQHARTGESVPFEDLDKLVAFFEGRTGKLADRVRQGLK